MKRLVFVVVVLQTLGCSNGSSLKEKNANNGALTTEETYPEKPVIKYKDNGDDTGDGDFALSIVEIAETDTTIIYKALSTSENGKLGLVLDIPKKDGEKGFGRSILIKSTGWESDNFIRFMAEEYNQKMDSSSHFIKTISVAYVNMHTFGKTLGAVYHYDSTIDEYKLFFEGPSKDDYAELYLNINKREKIIEFKEKDPEYRPQLIKFFRE
ncbi:hypothetical protein Q4E93_29625 [Flavitalea sp. BT771]|uniref:hypothetical protein n=1 Tax=Flavitalea sp. BT771 TaxID=3063329 RepID=UPI0026E2999D|nr:hypothetical protein [Flavitalea sp. BT771]MDO6434809.1 hypothetical protein [Flavitalea sp. BT771]MDV6223709.1 hypothetical protein [Flavitalea sp. BT771]